MSTDLAVDWFYFGNLEKRWGPSSGVWCESEKNGLLEYSKRKRLMH